MLRQTLRDLKNGNPPKALADKIHERGIVFVHVPKCAGSSVEAALRPHYRLSRKLIDPEISFEAAAKELGLTADDSNRHHILQRASEMRRTLLHFHLAQGVKCLTGHAPLGPRTIQAFAPSHDFVTLLRDPVERFKSHLAYNLNGGGGHGGINEGLDEFLRRPRARTMGALYVKYFSGESMEADFSDSRLIEAAKENLSQMAVIGFVEDMDNFADDLTCLTTHRVEIGRYNPTEAGKKQSLRFSDEQLARIEFLCTPDRAIYDWAREKFFIDLTTVEAPKTAENQ